MDSDRHPGQSRGPGGGIPRSITHVTFAHDGEERVANTATDANSPDAFTDRELLTLLERARKP